MVKIDPNVTEMPEPIPWVQAMTIHAAVEIGRAMAEGAMTYDDTALAVDDRHERGCVMRYGAVPDGEPVDPKDCSCHGNSKTCIWSEQRASKVEINIAGPFWTVSCKDNFYTFIPRKDKEFCTYCGKKVLEKK